VHRLSKGECICFSCAIAFPSNGREAHKCDYTIG
jgi:hypothetical protein